MRAIAIVGIGVLISAIYAVARSARLVWYGWPLALAIAWSRDGSNVDGREYYDDE